jgi:hypothetical protein
MAREIWKGVNKANKWPKDGVTVDEVSAWLTDNYDQVNKLMEEQPPKHLFEEMEKL